MLRRSTADFLALKAAIAGQRQPFRWPEREWGPGPEGPADALRVLQSFVKRFRADLARIEKELQQIQLGYHPDSAEAERQRQEQAQWEAQQLEAHNRARQELAKITI
jgi:hypothetical protein